MMKKLSIFLFAFLIPHFISAQSFKFEHSKDSITVDKNIETLANQLLELEYSDDNATDLDNLFRIYIAGKDYNKGLEYLGKLQKFYEATYGEFHHIIGIQYEMFLRKKLADLKNKDFSFDQTLDSIFDGISETNRGYSSSYFEIDTIVARKNFDKLLVKTKGQDSIQKDDAIKLCRSYAYFRTAFYVQLKGKRYLERVENEKYIVQDSVLITTKDNAKISAVVYRLRADSLPKPVVLNFSIYPSEGNYYAPKMSVSYGYVGVAAYTRGKRFSPDDVVSFEKDGQDIYDVVDWISKQPWCNGKVGMYGGSYLGFAQWAAMKKRHPALKTIVPMVSVGPGVDYPMYNNVFMSYMLRWIHYVENNKFIDSDEFYDEKKWDSLYVSWYESGKSFSKLDSIDKRPSKTFQRWISHPSYDSYWQNMMPYQKDFSKIDIPILSFTGYFDADQQGALHYLNEHYKYKPNANHYLVIGPYNHEGAQGYVSETINGYKLDSVANIEPLPMTFQWFDHILKDSIKPKFLKDRINYQVMGTNTWKAKPSVREVANDSLTFYLDHTLKNDHYILSLDKPREKGYIKEEFDFLDRTRILPFEKMPPNLVDSVIKTEGKKVFVSEAFDQDLEITGSFRGTIDLMINKKDLDIAMELYELKEDGTYISLSTYLGRASYAKNRSKRKLLRPNKKESVSIKNSSFISKLVNKGSRLVLVLGVNKNPKWQINYGTGKDVSTESIEDGKVPLHIKWLNSSTIRIPVFREK